MKKAKVSKGYIRHVWPWVKTLPDGTTVVKELPPQYRGLNGKPVPECIIDVEDEAQVGWRWDGEKYAPKPPKPPEQPKRDWLMEELATRLGESYDDLLKAAKQRKRDALSKTD